MSTKVLTQIPEELVEAIRDFPVSREIEHCGQKHAVSPFSIYFTCPACGLKMKLRSFSGCLEIEDVFDALFAWMRQPGAMSYVRQRQQDMADD